MWLLRISSTVWWLLITSPGVHRITGIISPLVTSVRLRCISRTISSISRRIWLITIAAMRSLIREIIITRVMPKWLSLFVAMTMLVSTLRRISLRVPRVCPVRKKPEHAAQQRLLLLPLRAVRTPAIYAVSSKLP